MNKSTQDTIEKRFEVAQQCFTIAKQVGWSIQSASNTTCEGDSFFTAGEPISFGQLMRTMEGPEDEAAVAIRSRNAWLRENPF